MKQGWEIKKLGEVCRFINGRAYSKHELLQQGKYPVLRVGNFFTNNHWYHSDLELDEDKYCDYGDLLYAWSASFGPRIWEGAKVIYHYHIWKVIPNTELITKEFLFQLLKWDTEAIKTAHGTGATMMHVGKNSIETRLVPLPPLPEQQRIVAILDEAFAAIAKAKANAEQNLRNAKELFESYLQNTFKSKIQGEISNAIDNLCELIVDCEHKTAPIQETGYPSIRTPNIGKGTLILDNVNRVSYETYLQWTRRAIPKADDLILAREAPAGNIAVIPENLECCLGQRTVLIRPKKDKLISKYLAYLILSKDVQEKLLLHSTGATVEHINMRDIRAFRIYNLSSIQEQRIIVQKLDALSAETKKLETIFQQKINDLEELKKSILQKAFNGELKASKEVAA
ncbi:restriction endonuclease subunit S [Nitrosomonas sp.]|uniref:restriction endonuclease subunit S n=1 Tax=Nitrosomonas sp. TaxID=42353 RepID=UPI00260C6901|nr:restriction endonuclease subunit S [Nitrosomonas sp.]